MFDEMDRVKKYELFFIVGLAIAFITYTLVIYYGNLDTEVMRDRYWKDVYPLFHGEVPIMEYPPFSLVFMAIPYLFAQDPFGYNAAYVAETYVFTIIGMILIRRITEHYGVDQVKGMALYSVLMLMFLEFVADRYDIFPAVLSLAAFYLLITKRTAFAFILLAIGMMTKLYPAMYLLLFLTVYIIERDWKGALSGLFWFIVGTLAILIPVMLIEPDMIYYFLGYHSDRPLEIGSVAATLIYPFSMIGLTDVWILPATAEGSFGSDNLMGDVPDAVASILMPTMCIVLITIVLFYGHIRNGKHRCDERLFLMCSAILAMTLGFIVFGKVFSSQYLIWAVPFYTLVVLMSPNKPFRDRLMWITILSFILTQINFTYIFGFLGGGTSYDDITMISMLIRNLMTVVTMAMVLQEMWRIHKEGFSGEEKGTDFEFTC